MTLTGLISLLGFGVLIGIRHAFEADHVAAVAGLAARRTSFVSVVGQGAIWGCGHTISLALIAGFMLSLGLSFPARLEWFFEFCVALLLLFLGGQLLWRMRQERVHGHAHQHADGSVHWHFHRHDGEVAASHHRRAAHAHQHARFGWAALMVGMLHGMAGSAALVLMAVERVGAGSWALAMAYVFAFGIGSILGMALCSVAISLPLRIGTDAHVWQSRISATIGMATLAVGVWMLAELTPL